MSPNFNELIETLWNVNVYDMFSEERHVCELIETLWNVNRLDLKMPDLQSAN